VLLSSISIIVILPYCILAITSVTIVLVVGTSYTQCLC